MHSHLNYCVYDISVCNSDTKFKFIWNRTSLGSAAFNVTSSLFKGCGRENWDNWVMLNWACHNKLRRRKEKNLFQWQLGKNLKFLLWTLPRLFNDHYIDSKFVVQVKLNALNITHKLYIIILSQLTVYTLEWLHKITTLSITESFPTSTRRWSLKFHRSVGNNACVTSFALCFLLNQT